VTTATTTCCPTTGQTFGSQLSGRFAKYQIGCAKPTADPQRQRRPDCGILDYDLGMSLNGLQHTTWMMPFSQNGWTCNALWVSWPGTSSQPFKTEQDYANWLRRVAGFQSRRPIRPSLTPAGMPEPVWCCQSPLKMIPQLGLSK
jgi:hypothetical protein